jgi:hypothetical protein
MPFLDPAETQRPGFMPQLAEPLPAPKPTLTELWDAATQDNTAVSIADYAGEQYDRSQAVPMANYDPFSDISGYEDYADSFVGADSPRELEIIKRKIDSERQARATIAAGGAEGVAVALASGLTDPINLLPGGIAFDAVRGGNIVKGAVSAGAAGLAAGAVSEGILQGTQETRTASESALNVAASTILAGAMGGALGAVARGAVPGAKSVSELERSVGEDLGLKGYEGGGGSVGAASVRNTTLAQEGVKSALMAEKLSQGNVIVGTPIARTLNSPSVDVRRIAGDLAEVPLYQNKNLEGIPSVPSVETKIKSWHAPLAEALSSVDQQFVKYRTGKDVPSAMDRSNSGAFLDTMKLGAGNIRDMVSRPEGQLSYLQFREEVGRAMRNADQHRVPEVAAAARDVRARLIDPLKDEAIAARLLPEDVHVDTAPSYLTRLYDVNRIIAKRPEFEGRISDWLGEMRDIAARTSETRMQVPEDAKAAKTLAAEKEMGSLTDGELRSIASEITDKIIGGAPGRIQYSPIPLTRGPLKERTLGIPDAMIEDFLHSDIEHVARVYTRTMSADVELTKKFGRADMEDQIRQVNDSYARLRKNDMTEAQLKKLEKQRQNDIQDIQGMRDRIRGTYALPADPNGLLARSSRLVRQLNFLRLMGGMTLTSISDVGRPVMIHGLGRVFGSGVVPLLKGAKIYKAATKEVKLAGTALDMVLDSRAMQLADIWDDYGKFSTFERGVQAMSDRFGLVSAMAPWNAFWKQFSGVVGQTRNLQAVEALTKGKATSKEIEHLAFLGIGREEASRIAEQFAKHGEKQDGVWWANTSDWTDREAAEAFRNAIVKETDLTIVTPGQDRPLWMSTELGKVVGQFRSFTMSSMMKVTQLGLQQRDAAVLQGIVLSVSLGMLSGYLRRLASGKPMPEDSRQWIAEGVDRSGVLSWLMDANLMLEKTTRNRVGLARLTGIPTSSRYASRNVVGGILGPTFGMASDAIEMTGSAATGQWTAADTAKARQMIPYQNLFYIRRLFDAAEEGTNEAFDIPQKKPN